MKGKTDIIIYFSGYLLQLDVEIWPQKSNKPSPKTLCFFGENFIPKKKKPL
jgi:hypothetical protein